MIYALALTNLATLVLLGYLIHRTTEERRNLMSAALVANGQPDAARTVRQPSPAEVRKAFEAQIEAQEKLREQVVENGGVFSAANPFGVSLPEGV